ncbi:MAG: hypothetical protein IJO53_13260 [Clostridia bacterium]|nr:hypothetical protein [Clostridia bacterium]
MDMSTLLQVAATLCAAWGAFSAYRVRDNERAATLSEIRNEIRHIINRLDRIENEMGVSGIERNKREEIA